MKISGTILKKKTWSYYNKEYCFTTIIGCEHTFLVKEDVGEVGEDVLLESGNFNIKKLSPYFFIMEKNNSSLHDYLNKIAEKVTPFERKKIKESVILEEIESDDLPF